MSPWIIVVALVASLFGIGNQYLSSGLPQTVGEVHLPQLRQEVQVYRDSYGVPHIVAANVEDAMFAQGYVTAQDRLWQIDMNRRVASGRLAEVAGPAALVSDRFYRTLGLARSARSSYAAASDLAKQYFEAYAAGVNAYIDWAVKSPWRLPVEYRLMGFKPTQWEPADTLVIGKLVAEDLGTNWRQEVERGQLTMAIGEDSMRALLPRYPEWAPAIVPKWPPEALVTEAQSSSASAPQVAALLPGWEELKRFSLPSFMGSNSWVVAGSKSASGKPLLANDPHLAFQLPSLWHQVHLVVPGQLNVTGVTVPGIPSAVFGQNERIVWGITSLMADVQDLYVEEPKPGEENVFRYGDRWQPATVLQEEIHVKGNDDPEVLEVVVTAHGPVLNSVLKNSPPQTLSLRWSALDNTREVEALFGLMQAENWTDFRTALAKWDAPALSFIYADVDGNIGYQAAGRIPLRAPGAGRWPVSGADPANEWRGFIPAEELPWSYNPSSGLIVTANNLPAGSSYPYYISDILFPERAYRILEVLEAEEKLTADDMRILQTDFLDPQAERLVPGLVAQVEKAIKNGETLNQLEQSLLDQMKSWDFRLQADSLHGLVWQAWKDSLYNALLLPKMGRSTDGSMLMPELLRALLNNEHVEYLEVLNVLPDPERQLSGLVTTAFKSAVAKLTKENGTDTATWKWGDTHALVLQHPMSQSAPMLGRFLDIEPLPSGGNDATVGARASDATNRVRLGASWRLVADLADLNHTKTVVLPGNSGHNRSHHYADQVDVWHSGDLLQQGLTSDEYTSGDLLRLIPTED